MKIKDLANKLAEKPQQQDVQFLVWTKDGDIVCAEMDGPMTQEIMRVMAKHSPSPKKPNR